MKLIPLALRTVVSPSYSCDTAWNDRFKSEALTKIDAGFYILPSHRNTLIHVMYNVMFICSQKFNLVKLNCKMLNNSLFYFVKQTTSGK